MTNDTDDPNQTQPDPDLNTVIRKLSAHGEITPEQTEALLEQHTKGELREDDRLRLIQKYREIAER